MSYLLGRRFESCPGRRFVVCGLRSAGCGLRLNTLCCQLVLNFESRPFLLPLCSCFFLALFPCVLKIPVYDTHNMSAGTNQLRPSNVRGSFCSIWIIVFRVLPGQGHCIYRIPVSSLPAEASSRRDCTADADGGPDTSPNPGPISNSDGAGGVPTGLCLLGPGDRSRIPPHQRRVELEGGGLRGRLHRLHWLCWLRWLRWLFLCFQPSL
ncbi:hypothetical protein V8E54_012265 [Elaphomyces granulatus]